MTRQALIAALAVCLAAAGPSTAAPGRFAGDEFQINVFEDDDQRVPAVATDPAGNSLVVWQSRGGPEVGWDVFARRIDPAGEAPDREVRVNDFTPNRQDGQHVIPLDSGGYAVTWNGQSRGATHGIHARRVDKSGIPLGTDRPVGGISAEIQILPRAAGAADDGYLVTWEGRGIFDDTLSVHGQFMSAGGDTIGPVIRLSQAEQTQQRRVDLARGENGGYMVVWQSSEQDGDNWGIFGRCLAGDGSGGEEFPVNQTTAGSQSQPRIAALGARGFAVVWHDDRGRPTFEYRRVMLRHFDQQCRPMGGEMQVNQFDERIQDLPEISAASDGSHIIVWQSLPEDFQRQGIYARRVDAEGRFHGNEIRVSQEREAFQDFPAVASLPDGGFIAVWESIGQDESGFGIFGRRFQPPVPAFLVAESGGEQATGIAQPFPAPLVVRLRDQWGVPVAGRAIRFASAPSGPGAVFDNGQTSVTTITDAEGLAMVNAVANQASGQHAVDAATVDGGLVTGFKLENRGSAPALPVAIPAGSWPAWLVLAAALLGVATLGGRRRA